MGDFERLNGYTYGGYMENENADNQQSEYPKILKSVSKSIQSVHTLFTISSPISTSLNLILDKILSKNIQKLKNSKFDNSYTGVPRPKRPVSMQVQVRVCRQTQSQCAYIHFKFSDNLKKSVFISIQPTYHFVTSMCKLFIIRIIEKLYASKS